MDSEYENLTSAQLWEHYMGKYKNPNRIARYLTDQFFHKLQSIITGLPESASLLEVGCGPGESTRRIVKMLNGQQFEASEFEARLVQLHQQQGFPVPIKQESVYELNRPDNAFDCVLLLEVLEHLDDVEKALEEIFRIAKRSVIISVPNEPLWRILNFCRGKYWGQLGNTPGHINHWSSSGFMELIGRYGQVVSVHKPIPWTIVHAQVNKGAP